MQRKLLVIITGSIAAGVGQEFVRQLKANPASELQSLVHYIDTACPIPGILNKRTRGRSVGKGIGTHGKPARAV